MTFLAHVKHWIAVTAMCMLVGVSLYSQSVIPEVDRDLFGTWLDRADRSVLREEWDAVAGSGEEAAMAEWEREALLLLESGMDAGELEALRTEARQEIEDIKNRRLVDWLMTRFVRDNTDFIAKEYITHLKETRNQTMFVMKDGKIERDATGKAVQTRLESEAAFTEELSRWQHGAAQYFEGILSRSKNSATTLFTDLLSSLDDQTRSLLEAEKDGLFYAMEQSQKRQGDLLLRLEQSEYRYFRLRDQYSLRLDSENASAESQAENLIEKTRASLQEGLDRIEQGLDGEIGDVVHEGYLVDGDGWRDAFKDEFSKGLALWDAAEEDFFVRRVEWERQAGNDLADGMDAWKRAFDALKEEQYLWLDEMDTLRKKGEDAFRREFDELADARTKALAELDASILENRGDLVERVESTVENLNRSLEMMNTARNSMDYWLSAVSSGEAYDLDLVSWSTEGMLESMLQKMISDAFGSLGTLSSDRDKTLSDFDQKMEDLLKNRLYIKIAKHYQDKVSSGDLDQFLKEKISQNSTRSLEEWQELLIAELAKGIENQFENWFREAFNGITVKDLIGSRPTIENPFRPEEAELKRLSEFNTVMNSLFILPGTKNVKSKDWYMIEYGYPRGESEYEKALEEARITEGVYTEAQDKCLNYSISVFFTDHPDVRKATLDYNALLSRFAENEKEVLNNTIDASVNHKNYTEAWYWYNTIYVHYAGEAEKQNDDLENTYGLVVFDSEKVPPEGYADDETIRGPIAALDEYGWESICLDDYQLELVKARAVEAYWKKEVDVAEAVYAYATDETYARDTEAETLQRSEAALSAYNAALAAYHEAVAALEVVNDVLGERRGEIEAARAKIAEKQEALAEAKREYADMIVMAELDTADFYVGQFRAQYEQLLSERGLLDEPSWSYDELGSGAKTYLGDVVIENCSAALAEAVNGNVLENPPLLSLSELGRIATLREQYTVPEDLEDAVGGNIGEYLGTQLGLGNGEYWYAVLEDAYEKRTESSMEELSQLFSAARDQLLVESKAAIDDRLLVIELLLSEDADMVKEKITGFVGATATTPETITESFELFETARAEEERKLLEQRLAYELNILKTMQDALDAYSPEEEDPEPFAIESLFAGDPEIKQLAMLLARNLGVEEDADALSTTITGLRTDLEALQDGIAGIESGSLADHAETLQAIAEGKNVLLHYLAGGTLFSDGRTDYVCANLESYAKMIALSGASSLVARYAQNIPSYANERREKTLDSFGSWLEDTGIGTYDGSVINFTSPETLWNSSAIPQQSLAETVDWLYEFEQSGQKLFSTQGAPDAVASLFEQWFDSLSGFVLAKAAYNRNGQPVPGDDLTNLKDTAESLRGEAETISVALELFMNTGGNTTRRAAVLLTLADTGREEFTAYREDALETLAMAFGAYCRQKEAECTEENFELWMASIDEGASSVSAAKAALLELTEDLLADEAFTGTETGIARLNSIAAEGESRFTTAMNAASEAYIGAATAYQLHVRYNTIASEAESSFRQYLAETHAKDLLYDFTDGETWADVEAYEQSTVTGTVCAETGRTHAYSTDGTVNVGLEYASFLDQYADAFRTVLASWTGTDEGTLNTFTASNAAIASITRDSLIADPESGAIAVSRISADDSDYSDALGAFLASNAAIASITRDSLIADPESGAIAVSRISADDSDYSDALGAFLSHVEMQKSLTYEMGKTAASVVAYLAAKKDETAEMTAGIRATIDGLEEEVKTLQNDWADLIGVRGDEGTVPAQGEYDEATYAELERAYTARYEDARAQFEALEDARQTYKIARAVHEYAATPYLGIDAEKTTEDEYVLVQALDAVDPDTRLAEAREKHLRSVAAREAIEAIYENDSPESLYERDERYRDLRDAYEKQYRYLLASKQMQVLLDKEIQKAHGKLAEAKRNYEDILASIQNLPEQNEDGLFTDETVTTTIEQNIENLGKYPKEMLAGLSIEDGTIQWNPAEGTDIPESVYSDITAYLTSEEGLKSEFVEDLTEWLMTVNQSKLNAMSNALSWEIFSQADGMTYGQFLNGKGEDENTIEYFTEYVLLVEWKHSVRDKIWDNLLSTYTGKRKSGDLWNGFEEAFSKYRTYRISETGLIDTLYTCHQSIASSDDYAFFKFAALTGLLGTEVNDISLVSTQLVNSLFSQTLFFQLGEFCQKEGRDSWFDKPAWHNRRDEANEASGSAALDYRIATGISTAATNLQKAQQTITEKQAALDLLTGTSVEGGPGVDDLVTSLVAANDNGSGLAVRDILKTAGIVYNEKTLEEDLRRIITSDDTHKTLRESDSSKLLATVVQNLTGDFEDSERALSEYLYSNSTEKPGVARTHAERRQEYAKAVSLFIEAGILPDDAVSEEDVEEWEALLRLDRDDTVMADVLAEAEWFLSHTDGIDSEQQAVRALAEVLDRYTSYADLKKAEGLNADTVHGRALASDVYGAFTALVQSYRIGIDYLAALEAALEEPAFDPRENALRECELFRAVLSDLQSETSGLGTYVLGSVTEAVTQSYVKLNDVRMSAIREARVNEWDIQLQELNGRHDDFTRQMNAIYSRGMLEWRKANRSITAAMEAWQQEYEDSFKTKAEDWTNQYITFLQKKEAWVDTIAEQAVQIGNNEILRNMGAMTQDAIADATTFIIPDVIELPDTDSFLASIVDRDLLSGLLSSAGERNRGIDAFTPAIFQSLKRNAYNSAETLDRIRIFQTEENEEIAARLAFIQYDQALTTLKDAKKSLEENIDGANRSTWAGFRDMFIRDGFTESGGNFIKNTTVGATLMDSLTEKHVIEGYRYFKTTVKDFTKGIMTPEEIDLEAIGATGIQALLDQAMGAVDEESKRIFGSSEDTTYEKDSFYADRYTEKKYRLGSEAGERIEELVEKVRYLPQTDTLTQEEYDEYMKKLATLSDEQTGKQAQQVRYREVRSGEFNTWVGYAPVFRDDAKPNRDMDEYWKNVRFAGAGETGRIMGLFTQHKMIESSGRAEANMPAYSRRLWDDRGSFMPAPTIRTLVDVAMTVAVSCFTGGAGGIIMNALISTAFNMIDDAVFTLMDMANGMDPLDAVEGFAKKAATTFASSAISGAFNGVVPQGGGAPTGGLLQTMKLTDNVIGSTMLKGTEIMASNVASSAINSFSLRGLVTGGDAFDEDAFGRGAFGRDAMAGVAAGMAGNFVRTGLDSRISNSSLSGFSKKYAGGVRTLTGTLGNLASTGVTYAMTDNARVNLINASMFGLTNKDGDAVSVGLFEFGFGKDGVQAAIGMGGTDMNLGRIASSINGINALYQNHKINEYTASHGGIEANVALRALFSYGDDVGTDTYRDILDGRTKLAVNENLEGDATAKTVMNKDGTKTIILRSLSNDVNAGVTAGIVLQHEAYRDGEKSADQQAETRAAVTGHTEMALNVLKDGMYVNAILSNGNLVKDIGNYMKGEAAFREYADAAYDSSGDYWRVLKNGDLYDDGLDDQISFEDGRETIKTGKGKQGTLEQYLGMEAGTGYSEILSKLGYGYEDGSWTFEKGTVISASMIEGLVDQGIVTNKDYNNPVAVAAYKQIGMYKDAAEKEEQRIKAIEREKQLQGTVYDKDTFLSQQDFEARYNTIPREKSCVTNGFIMGTAMMIGGLADPVLDKTVALAKEKGWMNPDGSLEKIDLFTRELLKASGKSGYISYAWDQETGNRISFKNEQSFKAAGYTYGRAVYNNRTTGREHSKLFYPGGYYDPLGERNYEGTYVLDRIEPFKWYN